MTELKGTSMENLVWKIPLGLLCLSWAWAVWKIVRRDDHEGA